MTSSKQKQLLQGLVKQARKEELENIKRSRRNARAPKNAAMEPYNNAALTRLAKEIARL